MQFNQNPKWRRSVPLAVIAIAASIAGAFSAQAASGYWFTESPMPQAVSGSATATYSGQLYVISGSPPGGGTITNDQVYNPATDTWTAQAPIPTGVGGANAGTIGSKIYVAGGCASNGDCRIGTTNTVQVFNTATNSWSTTTSLPTALSAYASGVISGKFYVVGGTSACPPCTPLSALEAYTPSTHLWTSLASMPTARRSPGGRRHPGPPLCGRRIGLVEQYARHARGLRSADQHLGDEIPHADAAIRPWGRSGEKCPLCDRWFSICVRPWHASGRSLQPRHRQLVH